MASVELAREGGIASLLLNRPDALNALSSELLDELGGAISEVESDAAIEAAILTGAGRAFAAGADISELATLDRARGEAFAQRGHRIFRRIEKLPKPIVAAVNGFALGGGCELAMACHMRIASTQARFGQPEVKLGLLPGFGGTQRLPRLVGRGIATEIALTGRMVSAEEALRIGLVNEIVEPEELLPRARALLEEILRNGPAAVAAALSAIDQGLDLPLDEALALEARIFGAACGSEEMQEGTQAFLEKRDPKFR